jgi:hypothetical protein
MRGLIVGIILALSPSGALAQQLLGEKLIADRSAGIEPGTYMAGDTLKFTIDPYGDGYLFRIANEPEVYVLRTDRAALGARVLKYDSGATALQVANWGALTIYTDQQPAGLPAVRDSDSVAPTPQPVSLADMQVAAGDETQHLSYVRKIAVTFVADWNAIANDANSRALVFDALQNAARGLERFTANDAARNAVAQKVTTVKLVLGKPSAILLWGKTLVIGIDPSRGYEGRASSRAVSVALGKLLSVRQAANG